MIPIYDTLIFRFYNLKNPLSITFLISTLLSFLSHLQSPKGKKTDTQNYFMKTGTIPGHIRKGDVLCTVSSVIHSVLGRKPKESSTVHTQRCARQDSAFKNTTDLSEHTSHIYLPHTHIHPPHAFACRNLCTRKFRTKPLLQGLTSDREITMENPVFSILKFIGFYSWQKLISLCNTSNSWTGNTDLDIAALHVTLPIF